jgi:ubiquinone biosynthesis protein COQ4
VYLAGVQSTYLPWALRAGTRCHDLMNVYYEHHFQVRRLAA